MVLGRADAVADTRFERLYPGVLISLWVLVPEIRRFVDWEHGFNSLSVINLLPTLALLPLIAVLLHRARTKMSYGFKIVAVLWIAAFGYSLFVGWLSSRLFGALYETTLFTFPLLLGVWLATMEPALARRILNRFVSAAIGLAIFVSLYGIYQYIAPPPWDVYWMINSGLASIGNPVPFEVRVFSSLNSPLTCADFLALTLLLALYRFQLKTIWLVIPLLLTIAALVLTLVRTAWLEVAVGVIVFICFSPRRSAVLGTAVFASVLTLLVATNLGTLTGNPQVAVAVQDRLETFSNLQDDGSADSREHGSATTLHQSLEEPLGQGLGFAAGAKLSGGATATAAATYGADNGYLERFLEMGIFGFVLYLASIGAALVVAFRGVRRSAAAGDDATTTLFATILAIEVALIGGDLSADHHISLMAIFYWIAVGMSSSLLAHLPDRTAMIDTFIRRESRNRPAGAR